MFTVINDDSKDKVFFFVFSEQNMSKTVKSSVVVDYFLKDSEKDKKKILKY